MADLFPDSVHVREIGLKSADDISVWEYAKADDLIIVSKDSDMHDRSFLFGYPPKVIWIRLGNCSISVVGKLLRREYETIETFYKADYASFLTLS